MKTLRLIMRMMTIFMIMLIMRMN